MRPEGSTLSLQALRSDTATNQAQWMFCLRMRKRIVLQGSVRKETECICKLFPCDFEIF